jgi:putative flippase GtrA
MRPAHRWIERNRFLKFATVGAMGTAIDFAVFNLLGAGWGWQPVTASIVSFSSAGPTLVK